MFKKRKNEMISFRNAYAGNTTMKKIQGVIAIKAKILGGWVGLERVQGTLGVLKILHSMTWGIGAHVFPS